MHRLSCERVSRLQSSFSKFPCWEFPSRVFLANGTQPNSQSLWKRYHKRCPPRSDACYFYQAFSDAYARRTTANSCADSPAARIRLYLTASVVNSGTKRTGFLPGDKFYDLLVGSGRRYVDLQCTQCVRSEIYDTRGEGVQRFCVWERSWIWINLDV